MREEGAVQPRRGRDVQHEHEDVAASADKPGGGSVAHPEPEEEPGGYGEYKEGDDGTLRYNDQAPEPSGGRPSPPPVVRG